MSGDVVRHATLADEAALIDIYITLHREGLGRLFPYNYQRVLAGIQKATRKQGGICGVIDAPNQEGRLAGLVFILLDQWWWSDCAFLLMRECYVRREYRRGTGYFDALREWAEDIRKSADNLKPEGHPPILLEVSFIEEDSRREALMQRLWRKWGKRMGSIHVSGL